MAQNSDIVYGPRPDCADVALPLPSEPSESMEALLGFRDQRESPNLSSTAGQFASAQFGSVFGSVRCCVPRLSHIPRLGSGTLSKVFGSSAESLLRESSALFISVTPAKEFRIFLGVRCGTSCQRCSDHITQWAALGQDPQAHQSRSSPSMRGIRK